MKTIKALSLAIAASALVSCGDNNRGTDIDAGTDGGDQIDNSFRQVEHLARPGINEALLISQDFLNGYNATAPTFAGVPEPTLNAVVGEAKTVLKALYLGACLLNGALGLTPATGVKPAGITCHAVGPAIWVENDLATGSELTAASKTAAQAYADKVFGQFIPDVMRVDTAVTSYYQELCGDASSVPLLCGGRFLNDDTIDITYDYLLNGAGTPSDGAATYNQVSALVSDGVNFSATAAQNHGNRVPSSGSNPQQFHPAVSQAFPYSAPPL